ncbi:unnamed protein product [Rhodiola kirilowii]
MPETRSMTEVITALTQSVVELSARTRAVEEKTVRHEERFELMMGILEHIHGKPTADHRAGKEPMEASGEQSSMSPLLSTPMQYDSTTPLQH